MTKIYELQPQAESVLKLLLSTEERETMQLEFADSSGAQLTSTSTVADGDLVHVLFPDDLFIFNLSAAESAPAYAERFRSELADFIATSTFGWGENRDIR
ncbi:hypothetical protein JOE58_001982 [Curtobacterium luteum]|uniref:Uncharacterized protein n=1 Tax=Curtobacterium luteum TaxID=33881 RepID=A0A8H9GBE0_9MICO|nr:MULTISPECIES: hypothetical protein [Curtobacterium]MBM7802731.1 hypothetical protein [Curtobacterium luteum]NUU49326.1 hypothetical protein [Curtobacterium luteum]GGL12947.1 hypothetical protein GCM10009769_33670 [Curtobacterium luteum]